MNDLISQTLSPTSIEEVCDAVRAHNHSAIYPVGAGSWMDLGYPRTKPGIEISTLQLNRVVDYPHEELTITVEAGILISELSKILAQKGQMLPFDCPYPENATLGGLLATNTCGPRRLAYGTARDSVIGLDVVNAQGERIHGGGRVVKNVAGYDMPKMHIGALGTLGIIVEATIKVRPMAEATETLRFALHPKDIDESLMAIRNSRLRPCAVELETRNATLGMYMPPHDTVLLELFFEDSAEAIHFQSREIEVLPKCFVPLPSETEELETFFDNTSPGSLQASVNRVAYTPCMNHCFGMAGRLCVRPSTTGAAVNALLEDLGYWKIKTHAMSGVILAFFGCDSDLLKAKTGVETIRRLARELNGRFSIPRCPDDWKRSIPIWGDLGPENEWMRRLRDSLDPKHVLNPGRFVVD